MPISPEDSALDALVAYFASLSGIAGAKRGWPEHPDSFDLSAGPVLTLTMADSVREPVSPGFINDAPPFLVRINEVTIGAQLDLWAAYRAHRDDAARVIEDALHNQLPWRHGLYLSQPDYHDRPMTVTATPVRNEGDERAAVVGEWRRTWMLEIVTDHVIQTNTPALSEVVLRDQDGLDPDVSFT